MNEDQSTDHSRKSLPVLFVAFTPEITISEDVAPDGTIVYWLHRKGYEGCSKAGVWPLHERLGPLPKAMWPRCSAITKTNRTQCTRRVSSWTSEFCHTHGGAS